MTIESKSQLSVDNVAVDSDFGNEDDQRDMLRMGKAQELRVCSKVQAAESREILSLNCLPLQRDFGFASIFGFSMILQQTWEVVLRFVDFGLATRLVIRGTESLNRQRPLTR